MQPIREYHRVMYSGILIGVLIFLNVLGVSVVFDIMEDFFIIFSSYFYKQ